MYVCLSVCPSVFSFQIVTTHSLQNIHWHTLRQMQELVSCYLLMLSFFENLKLWKKIWPGFKILRKALLLYEYHFYNLISYIKIHLSKGYKLLITFFEKKFFNKSWDQNLKSEFQNIKKLTSSNIACYISNDRVK